MEISYFQKEAGRCRGRRKQLKKSTVNWGKNASIILQLSLGMIALKVAKLKVYVWYFKLTETRFN